MSAINRFDAIVANGNITAFVDDTYDIGGPGINRFRKLTISGDFTTGGRIFTTRNTQTGSSVAGDVVLPGSNAFRFAHPTVGINATYTYASLISNIITFGDVNWELTLRAASTIAISSGLDLQLGRAYAAGVVAATGTIPIKDSTGTSYNVLVHT